MTTPTPEFDQGRRTPTSTGRFTVAAIAARLAGEQSTVDTPSEPGRPSEAPTDPANPVGSAGSGPRYPVAPKVRMAGLWSLLGSLGIGAAVLIAENPAVLGNWLPDWAAVIVLAVAGAVAALWGGWRAPHQPRPGDGLSGPGSPAGGS